MNTLPGKRKITTLKELLLDKDFHEDLESTVGVSFNKETAIALIELVKKLGKDPDIKHHEKEWKALDQATSRYNDPVLLRSPKKKAKPSLAAGDATDHYAEHCRGCGKIIENIWVNCHQLEKVVLYYEIEDGSMGDSLNDISDGGESYYICNACFDDDIWDKPGSSGLPESGSGKD